MNFEKIYREIKPCPWCLNKPTLTITPYPNKVTFDVGLGCRNMKNCLFNPHQELTCSLDELDSCIVEIIDNWNGRTESSVPPPQITITADTESKWTLSEALEEVKEYTEETNDSVVALPCRDCKYLQYKYGNDPYSHTRTNNFCLLHHKIIRDTCKESCYDFNAEHDYNVDDRKCVLCKHWYLDENNYAWCKRHTARTVDALKECRYKDFIKDEPDENKCADCKHYWYCAGEECCNLDELSFPEPCNKFEEDSE